MPRWFAQGSHCSSLHPQRVLGVIWDLQDDKLLLKMKLTNATDESNFTLRILLSLIANVFDPLGLVATLKIILCRRFAKLELLGRKFAYHIPETNPKMAPREIKMRSSFSYALHANPSYQFEN